MRIRLGLLLLLASCGSEASGPFAPPEMPTAWDVVPLSPVDRSCGCVLRGECAMIADAVPGRWEVRNLSCEPAGRRTARCRFEARFIELWDPARPRPGEWASRDAVYYRTGPGAWCQGTG